MRFRTRCYGGGEIPRMVAVETTSRCNASCPFCPCSVKQRDKVAMQTDLFEKIIEDCRQFPLEEIEPFLNGEPFVDPDILPRLEHIRRRLPATRVRLYTNGYGLTPKKTDGLAEFGIDSLVVSVNTLDPIKYKRIMGLSLERTLANVRYLTEPARRDLVAREIKLRMTRMDDTTVAEQDQFLALCRELRVKPFIVGLFNYKGEVSSSLPVPRYACEHTTRLDILSDGTVTLCCQDQEGTYAWGDVRTESVLEVYRGAIASRYRVMHRSGRRRQMEPCGSCNLFWPSFEGLGAAETVRSLAEAGLYMIRFRPSGKKAPASDRRRG